MPADPLAKVEAELLGLKKQVGFLRAAMQKAGVLPEPEEGACRLGFPDGECTEAKPYQYQKGCRNPQCRAANHAYYSKDEPVVETPVTTPKKRMVKRA